ncbi:MAG: glycogen/starch synthase [Chitinophagaceae bacterium]|nr:glycogen/starch synthase [Chitinophagaceae bacterium]
MEILHVSAECYPVAKVGGLGDVVGALPKYQQKLGHIAKVVLPMYRTKFLFENQFDVVHKGAFSMDGHWLNYTIIKEKTNKLGFDLYLVDIMGILDRERVYGYDDDTYRFIAFQRAVVDWVGKWQHRPDIIHAHDHHCGLIPFMMQYSYEYNYLSGIKTIFTIHNGQYQGWMGWDQARWFPAFDAYKWGMLDWNNMINPLAAGVKCAYKVNTVSSGYLEELRHSSKGLEHLFEYERGKCFGILNGIDTEVWNPETDSYLQHHYSYLTADEGKRANKKALCDEFGLDINKPLFIFIGRMVEEKAADLLPQAISDSIYYMNGRMNFLVLGSGSSMVEQQLESMRGHFFGYYNSQIGYNEALSHKMYAGADFLLMPSRVEPCGLNQMYALRYGTVPIVRRTGGLNDTVVDYGDEGGFGVCFREATVGEITHSVYRALQLYEDKERMGKTVEKIMQIDHSWERSAQIYINLYNS